MYDRQEERDLWKLMLSGFKQDDNWMKRKITTVQKKILKTTQRMLSRVKINFSKIVYVEINFYNIHQKKNHTFTKGAEYVLRVSISF